MAGFFSLTILVQFEKFQFHNNSSFSYTIRSNKVSVVYFFFGRDENRKNNKFVVKRRVYKKIFRFSCFECFLFAFLYVFLSMYEKFHTTQSVSTTFQYTDERGSLWGQCHRASNCTVCGSLPSTRELFWTTILYYYIIYKPNVTIRAMMMMMSCRIGTFCRHSVFCN